MNRLGRRKAATALLATGVIAMMLGLTAAAVPLYRLFCQVTGYGGTTQVAEALPAAPLTATGAKPSALSATSAKNSANR